MYISFLFSFLGRECRTLLALSTFSATEPHTTAWVTYSSIERCFFHLPFDSQWESLFGKVRRIVNSLGLPLFMNEDNQWIDQDSPLMAKEFFHLLLIRVFLGGGTRN